MKTTVIATLLLLFVTILCSSIFSNDNKWGFEIALEKQNYLKHEKIWLDATITNISSDSIRKNELGAPFHFEFTIDLKDKSGKLLDYTGPVYSFIPGPGEVVLKPGEHEYKCYNLVELFDVSVGRSAYLTIFNMFFPYLPVGSYTLQAHFEGVSSNQLLFNIVEATGEEKEALDIIIEACTLFRRKNANPSGQKFQEIDKKYPNSVYAETSFYLSQTYTENRLFEGLVDKISLRRMMLQKFPNSGTSRGWIKSITRSLEKFDKVDFINKTIEQNPSSRAAKFAKQILKQQNLKLEDKGQ